MSYACRTCGGLRLEGTENLQNWGYGGKWCQCEAPVRPGQLTEADVRRIIRQELGGGMPGMGQCQIQNAPHCSSWPHCQCGYSQQLRHY